MASPWRNRLASTTTSARSHRCMSSCTSASARAPTCAARPRLRTDPTDRCMRASARDLTASEREERRSLGRQPSLRVRMQGTVEFGDDLAGLQRERLEDTSGDIVLRRSDGVVAYQLAVVVDDADQGVTHVVRGADLLDSTARQLRLYELLERSPSRATHTSHCCSALTASGSRSATAPSDSRSCAAVASTRRRSSAGSRTAPGCSSAPSPVLRATWSSTSTPPHCRGSPRASIQANCAGSLAAC